MDSRETAITAVPTNRDDLEVAASWVRSGRALPQWGVFPVRTAVVAVLLLGYELAGAVAIVVGWSLSITGTILGARYLPARWTSGASAQAAELVELALSIAIGLGMIGVGLGLLPRLRSRGECFLVVTHAGFAEVQGQRVRGCLFHDMHHLIFSTAGSYGARIIVILRTNHRRLVYNLGPTYGPARDVYAYLLAAYNARSLQRYHRAMGGPQVTRPRSSG
jgi:hypothetical protein